MKYEITILPRAMRDLGSFSPEVAHRILRKIEALGNDLAGDVKRLTRFTPEYRLRAGDYRVLLTCKGIEFSFKQFDTAARRMIDSQELAMLELHPEFLKKNGQNEFVVLPYEEFVKIQECLEDAEDLLELRRAREENAGQAGVSLDEAKKHFGLDN